MIDGIIRLMATGDAVTGPINLGNPEEFTMAELAERIIAMSGSPSRIVHRALPQDDPKQRRPDISRANELLGWSPKVAIEDGLAKTIGYFETLLMRKDIHALLGHDG